MALYKVGLFAAAYVIAFTLIFAATKLEAIKHATGITNPTTDIQLPAPRTAKAQRL
jgi:hypothetical protein